MGFSWAHCSKLKLNCKKLSRLQFHFPGNCPDIKTSNLDSIPFHSIGLTRNPKIGMNKHFIFQLRLQPSRVGVSSSAVLYARFNQCTGAAKFARLPTYWLLLQFHNVAKTYTLTRYFLISNPRQTILLSHRLWQNHNVMIAFGAEFMASFSLALDLSLSSCH